MANLQIIKKLAKDKGITLKSLAEQAGLTEQGLHKAIAANSTSIDTLERIAAQLEVSPRIFFPEDKGLKVALADHGSQAETGDNVTQINADPKLIDTINKQADQMKILINTNAQLTQKLLAKL